jgi:hypothetical protein
MYWEGGGLVLVFSEPAKRFDIKVLYATWALISNNSLGLKNLQNYFIVNQYLQ